MKTVRSLEAKLAALRAELAKTNDPDVKAELDEQIDYIQDDIDELEEAERDNAEYEEMMGITPQDLYNERNAYALRQSEMIERFRSEY